LVTRLDGPGDGAPHGAPFACPVTDAPASDAERVPGGSALRAVIFDEVVVEAELALGRH
jgi:hypothetical protein